MPLAVRIALALLLALALLWVVVQSRARTQEARAEAAFPPEGRILEVNGHRVHALSMGSGPDIVLIHGASGNLRDMTLSLAPRLAKRYRVTLLDRPGLGYTDRINRSGATIRQQAELLSDAARQIGVEIVTQRRPVESDSQVSRRARAEYPGDGEGYDDENEDGQHGLYP